MVGLGCSSHSGMTEAGYRFLPNRDSSHMHCLFCKAHAAIAAWVVARGASAHVHSFGAPCRTMSLVHPSSLWQHVLAEEQFHVEKNVHHYFLRHFRRRVDGHGP